MTNTEAIQLHVTEENIEFKLFINAAGKPAVRAYDLDAQATYGIVVFPTMAMAEAYFAKEAR